MIAVLHQILDARKVVIRKFRVVMKLNLRPGEWHTLPKFIRLLANTHCDYFEPPSWFLKNVHDLGYSCSGPSGLWCIQGNLRCFKIDRRSKETSTLGQRCLKKLWRQASRIVWFNWVDYAISRSWLGKLKFWRYGHYYSLVVQFDRLSPALRHLWMCT